MQKYDVIIVGAGAAGLAAAAVAISRGRNVAIIDMGDVPARKVVASGGGRCNFTNSAVAANRYFGINPNFVRGAIARTTPFDILAWATAHNIQFVEKAPGQYFTKHGAKDIATALINDAHGAEMLMQTSVISIHKDSCVFNIKTNRGLYSATSVIIATGGTSFPTLGASDFGYVVAKQFGHKIIPIRPALCAIATKCFSSELAGISIDVEITVGREIIRDSMLFTHFGIGGPAVYRTTVRDFDDISINFAPGIDVYAMLTDAKHKSGRKSVAGILAEFLPTRLAKWICSDNKHIADYRDAELRTIANKVQHVSVPKNEIKLHGMQSAEVVRGGVDTSQISSKTMESKLCQGLFFAGEVLDISGDLGGFNLHWAWASGRVAGANA